MQFRSISVYSIRKSAFSGRGAGAFAPLPASPRFGWASRWEELAVYHCSLTR